MFNTSWWCFFSHFGTWKRNRGRVNYFKYILSVNSEVGVEYFNYDGGAQFRQRTSVHKNSSLAVSQSIVYVQIEQPIFYV